MILIGAGSAVELRHCLDKPFQPQSDPPPTPTPRHTHTHRYTRTHSHFFACETTWMPMRGVGLRTDWEGSQEKTAVPRVYTPTPPWTQDPPHTHTPPPPTPTFRSISYRPGKFTLSCFWVWQQQLSCVWRAQQQRPANAQGGFSFFAVDLGLALHTSRRPASVRHGAPHCKESTTSSLGCGYLKLFNLYGLFGVGFGCVLVPFQKGDIMAWGHLSLIFYPFQRCA